MNDEDSADVTVDTPGVGVDAAVEKTASITEAQNGDTVVYDITVSNEGTETATGVVVTDNLPGDVSYTSDNAASLTDDASNPTSYDDTTGEWTVGTLNAGSSLTLQITTEVTINGGADCKHG